MNTVRHRTSKVHHSFCVGIITIPHSRKTKYGMSHIMKPYVDWFEERGIRVIPIPYDTTQHEMFFNMINGLFIPGGETPYIMKNNTFVDSVTKFFELSLQKNEYFPIWGTCFGFELLMFLIGGFTKLKRYNDHKLSPIHITHDGYQSRMLSSFPKRYLHFLENHNSTLQNHEYGISPDDFMNNLHLKRFYSILATAVGEDNKEYVAIIEAKYYPIYGVQFHPERQKTTGHFIDFFISELKKNKHKSYSTIPSIRSVLKAHKCTQYPEHKHLLCYFF
jgi:gamma-glutamyl hydrolase